MEILITILAYIFTPVFAYKLATGFVYRWQWVYKWREKIKLLNRYPFACAPCLSSWITVTILSMVFCRSGIFNWYMLANVIISLITYFTAKIIEDYKDKYK